MAARIGKWTLRVDSQYSPAKVRGRLRKLRLQMEKDDAETVGDTLPENQGNQGAQGSCDEDATGTKAAKGKKTILILPKPERL